MECVGCAEEVEDRRNHEKECSELCGDLMKCQECCILFDSGYGGYYIDVFDVGHDSGGELSRIFKQDAENFGHWIGFTEEDIGPVCDHCSYALQNRRTILRGDYGYEILNERDSVKKSEADT